MSWPVLGRSQSAAIQSLSALSSGLCRADPVQQLPALISFLVAGADRSQSTAIQNLSAFQWPEAGPISSHPELISFF
ncbi:hypothetical protein J6590_054345 [Homalodisca vitripennis]|nr:hypothetical protein J6590_054345 [Homalodisca vitripennis]